MGQAVIAIDDLGDDPLTAAARFHAEWLPKVRDALEREPDNLVLSFKAGDYRQRNWRLAAVQELALTAAPVRVNAIAGQEDSAAAKRTLGYLDNAPGVTGQLLDQSEAPA